MDRDVSQHYAGIVSKLFDDSRAKFIDEMTRGLDHAYYLANVNLCNGIENRILPPVYQMTDADYYILGEEYRSQITEYVYRGLINGSWPDKNGQGSVSNTLYGSIFYITAVGEIYYMYGTYGPCTYIPKDAGILKATAKFIPSIRYLIISEYINVIKLFTIPLLQDIVIEHINEKVTEFYQITNHLCIKCDIHLQKYNNTMLYNFVNTTIEPNGYASTNYLKFHSDCTCLYPNQISGDIAISTHKVTGKSIFDHITKVIKVIELYFTENRHQLNPTFANIQLLREIEKKQQALTLQTKQAQDAAEESKRALQELADKQQEIIRINAEAQESADITAQINQDTLIKIERDSAILSEKLAAYNALSSTDAIVDKMKTLVAGTNLVFSDLGNTITECAQHIPALISVNEDLAQKLSEKIAAFNTMRREIVETQRLLYKQSSAAFNMHQIDICPVVVACPINSEIMPPGSIYETGSNSIKRRVK